mgnify:CR=1 FL=1
MTDWNSYQEDMLKRWSSMSKTYSNMHILAADHYNKWDKRLGLPVVLLGAISASSIFTNIGNVEWTYVNGSLVLLMTGISAVSKFLGTNEKMSKHKSASFKYTKIAMTIDSLLSFPRHSRIDSPRDVINRMKLEILEVREHTPDLPIWIISNSINKFDKSITDTRTRVNNNNNNLFDTPTKSGRIVTISDSDKDESIDVVVHTIIQEQDDLISDKEEQIMCLSNKLECEENISI